MLRQCSTYLLAARRSQILLNPYCREFCYTSKCLSIGKRRKLVQTKEGSQKKSSNITNESPLLEPPTSKIVQLRPITNNIYPFIGTTQSKSKAFSHSTTCPPPPPTCNPCPPPPCPPPCPPPPRYPCPPPPKKSNTLRNSLLALLAGGAIAGGLYFYFKEDPKPPEEDPCDSAPLKCTPTSNSRNPLSKCDFPGKVPYLLVGGGTASFAAFRAIKSREPDAKVLVVSAEDALPYMRPPLSKEIWHQETLAPTDKLVFRQWNGQERSIYYEPLEFYTNIKDLCKASHGGVSVATGWVVSKVDPCAHKVEIEDPQTDTKFEISYEKCLIATGSRPKNLPIFEQANPIVKSKVVLFRSLRDLENLWSRLSTVKSVAIVGGGFLGSELACALAYKYKGKNLKIQQVFKESGNMGNVLPGYLSEWTTEKVRSEGVNIIPGVRVKEVDMYNNDVVMTLSNESSIKADLIIVAVGSNPNIQLADTSDLEVHDSLGGFLVNAELEARTDLYIAGDVSCFYDPVLGRRRVEHHDHAVVSGRLAGENMTGAAKGYKHQSMFWSDLGHDIGYEAIGIVDSCLPTVGVFAKGLPDKTSDRLNIDGNQESGIVDKPDQDNGNDESVSGKSKNESGDDICEKRENLNMENIEGDENENPKNGNDGELDPLPKGGVSLKCKDVTNTTCDYNKGVVFYLKDDIVVGILLWNVFNRMHIARQVLAERKKYEDLNEVAKLFKIHEEDD